MGIIKTLFNPSYGYARGIVAVILGLALVCWPSTIINVVLYVLGALLLILAAVNFVKYFGCKDKNERETSSLINGICALVVGIIFLVATRWLVQMVGFILGALLVVLAIMQIVNLIKAGKTIKVDAWLYLFPVATIVLGVICLLGPNTIIKTLAILFGLGIFVYGVSEIISINRLRKAMKVRLEKSDAKEAPEVPAEKPAEAPAETPAETPSE